MRDARPRPPEFRASCIITCYNYDAFVADAIQSAMLQKLGFGEIVVVDDASTDRSVEIIESQIKGHPNCRIVRRNANGGQLRALEDGVLETSGNWVFFLDADDYFSSEWVSAVREVTLEAPATDFVYSRPRRVDGCASSSTAFALQVQTPALWCDMGYTLIRTYATGRFVGSPTSGLCLSRRILDQLFPARWHDDFRTRADDWLVFGASLLGARKVLVKGDYVAYRQHGRNAWASNPMHAHPDVFFRRQLALHRTWREFESRAGIDSRFMSQAHLEFKSHPDPDWQDLFDYLRIVLKSPHQGVSRRIAIAVILKHFLRAKKGFARRTG